MSAVIEPVPDVEKLVGSPDISLPLDDQVSIPNVKMPVRSSPVASGTGASSKHPFISGVTIHL